MANGQTIKDSQSTDSQKPEIQGNDPLNLCTESQSTDFDSVHGRETPIKVFSSITSEKYVPSTSASPTRQIELSISDLSCASCVVKVQQALAARPGVISASVNFATEKALVEYESKRVGLTTLIEAVG